MSGGTISGNGYGVGVDTGSTFTMTEGTISDNTGGGVYVYQGFFTKTGGTITGSDAEDGNVATQRNGGNAVCIRFWNGSNYVTAKRKETTSGPEDNLSIDCSTGASSGAWD